MRAAYFGTFDPPTYGHLDVIQSAMQVVDELYIVVASHPEKKHLFDATKRVQFLLNALQELDVQTAQCQVHVQAYSGFAADFCKEQAIDMLFRGVRTGADVEYENSLAHFNYELAGVRTLYVPPTTPKYIYTSSSAVRELLAHGKDVSKYVPRAVLDAA